VAYGTIVAPGLPPYRITAEDRLWAARASDNEGGLDPSDTLWTWTQRYSLPAFRRRYDTLAKLIKAHSQPVNPIWRRDGSKCVPGSRYYGTDRCSERRLARRDRAARMSFSETKPEVQRKVDAWAKGQLPNPVPRAVDFADEPTTRAFLSRTPGSRLLKRAGNWVVGTRESLGWSSNHVRITPGAGPDVLGVALPVAGGAFLLAAAGFAFWAWHRSR